MVSAGTAACFAHRGVDDTDEDEFITHQAVDTIGESDITTDLAHCKGLHKGYEIYQEQYITQERLEHYGILKQTLADAFGKLPKLRKFTLADYRFLVKSGESFDACCRRLFGNVHLPVSLERLVTDPFRNFLCTALAVAPEGRIQSLVIPQHAFEVGGLVRYDPCSRDSMSIHAEDLRRAWNKNSEHHGRIFAGLQELRLPVRVNEQDFGSPFITAMKGILSPMRASLIRLTLNIDSLEDTAVLYDHF